MTAFTQPQLDAMRAEIQSQLQGFGSLFSAGLPAAPAVATPAGFGLVETEFTDGAPQAVQAKSLRRAVVAADVPNANNAALADAGIALAVGAGQTWILHGALYFGSSAGTTAGIIAEITGPASAASRASFFSGLAGNTFLDVVSPLNATAGNFLAADLSAADGALLVDGVAVNFSGAGNIGFSFKPVTNTQNYILRATSWLMAVRVA